MWRPLEGWVDREGELVGKPRRPRTGTRGIAGPQMIYALKRMAASNKCSSQSGGAVSSSSIKALSD